MDKKIAYAYTVTVYENGDVEVNPLEVEGGRTLSNPEIMDDICNNARKIELKQYENAAFVGTMRAFAAMNEASEQQATVEQ